MFVGFPALVFCIYVLSAFVTDTTFTPMFLGVETIVFTFVVILVSVALVEELFGWRGFAMPRILNRWGDLTANSSASAGGYGTRIHLSGSTSPSLLVIQGLYFFAVLGVSIVMTRVYRNTESALLAGVDIHASVYFTQLYVMNTPIPFVHFYLLGIIAVIVVAVYGTERFSRNPLEPSEENSPLQQALNGVPPLDERDTLM